VRRARLGSIVRIAEKGLSALLSPAPNCLRTSSLSPFPRSPKHFSSTLNVLSLSRRCKSLCLPPRTRRSFPPMRGGLARSLITLYSHFRTGRYNKRGIFEYCMRELGLCKDFGHTGEPRREDNDRNRCADAEGYDGYMNDSSKDLGGMDAHADSLLCRATSARYARTMRSSILFHKNRVRKPNEGGRGLNGFSPVFE
jgi:hypothetical protein